MSSVSAVVGAHWLARNVVSSKPFAGEHTETIRNMLGRYGSYALGNTCTFESCESNYSICHPHSASESHADRMPCRVTSEVNHRTSHSYCYDLWELGRTSPRSKSAQHQDSLQMGKMIDLYMTRKQDSDHTSQSPVKR